MPNFRGHRLALAASILLFGNFCSADTFRIEIDYMVGAHSHMPTQDEIDAVVQMFACAGHTLIIDVDDALTHNSVLQRDPGNSNNFFGYSGTSDSFGSIKAANFDNGAGWHYCIFSHNYEDQNYNVTTSSGLAEIGGNDLTVSLGSFSGQVGTPFDKASTLAHEFGHNLGLSHCGGEFCGNPSSDPTWVSPYVPNLPSVMTYNYQLAGVRSGMICLGLSDDEWTLFREIDYSRGRLCTINETALSETDGIGINQVNWNCDADLTDTGVDADTGNQNGGWCGDTSALQTISDYNEWANISSSARSDISIQMQDRMFYPEPDTCLTAEDAEFYKALRGGCAQPVLETENCMNRQNVFVDTTSFLEIGWCDLPYVSLDAAENVATTNSVIWVNGGTYTNADGTMLDRPVYVNSLEGALFE